MKLLLIGASSYLGARIFFDLKSRYELVGTYSSNKLSSKFLHLDITDPNELKKVFEEVSPDVVIHTANNANSKWCDEHQVEANLLNEKATELIVEECNSVKTKLIFISSMAADNPTNQYGKMKVTSEEMVKNAHAGYLILRPSLIIGYSPNTSNDRPFNRILRNIDSAVPAVYEDLWNFQPTYIRHISEVIDGCIEKNIWDQLIYVIAPETTTRYRIACDLLNPLGITVEKDKEAKKSFKDFVVTTKSLSANHLPEYTYTEIIEEIEKEIREREKFKLE